MKRPAANKRPKGKRGESALIDRLSAKLPKPSRQATARVRAWLAGLRPKSTAASLVSLVRRHPAAAQILGGIAEAAPYLWDAIATDPARLRNLLGADPDRTFDALIGKIKVTAAAARSQAALMRILREAKLEAALFIALTDIGGVWTLAQVTKALSRFADTAVSLAVNCLLREAIKHKKLGVVDPKNPQTGSGYIVLAMGKMGAGELNFSSDI